jgi:hypothetical protein
MPNTPEAAALRLRAFIRAVESKARAYMGPNEIGQPTVRPRKDPLTTTYEECLGQLAPGERNELDRMIRKMSSILGSPPSAIARP